MPGNKKKTKTKKKTIIIKIKKKKTINLTKILYKTAIFNLRKVNIKSLLDKKEIYGGI